MAHLKMDMLLRQTGYHHSKNNRLHIYLTNSLEESRAVNEMLPFAQWLSDEANEANRIKKDVPVMVVMGNPPYNISTQNTNDWIDGLIADYKQELDERNIQPLSDDYIKFIRLGQHFIEKNGGGILAYISNNSFIDGVIHRQMRKNLLETFDHIYLLDLHGNAKKKETSLDGGKDENVFNIQQGVSINIFVKTGHKAKEALAEVYHYDLFGKRAIKFDFLAKKSLHTVKWKKVKLTAPYYFFKPKNFSRKKEYEKGFKVNELFPVNSCGIQTKRDSLFLDWNKKPLKQKLARLLSGNFDDGFRETYNVNDSSSYNLLERLKRVSFNESNIRFVNYRPFDYRFIYYDKNLIGRPFYDVMKHFIKGENVGLLTCRQQSTFDFQHIFVSNLITDMCAVSLQTKETTYVFPLYLYPNGTAFDNHAYRMPNLNPEIVGKIAESLNMKFEDEKSNHAKKFAPVDLLDYIYAALHCPAYRERYKEFLKIDFPRVPYPDDVRKFRKLIKLGEKLRCLHLMENVEPFPIMANFPVAGSNEVEKLQYVAGTRYGRVFINAEQFFDHVPVEAWEFYIGGYQPAQKWLKDRKGRTLNYDDIQHYQRIIRVLKETGETMLEIDAALGVE
jgi:predicted helicase